MIFRKCATDNIATQFLPQVRCISHPFFIFLFSFLQKRFSLNLCLNLSTIRHLLYFNLSSSSHIILIFNPLTLPTSHLPSPSPFAWAEANLWSPSLSTPMDWTVIVIYLYFVYFLYFDISAIILCQFCKIKDRTSR